VCSEESERGAMKAAKVGGDPDWVLSEGEEEEMSGEGGEGAAER
jgi:hypothetical protein